METSLPILLFLLKLSLSFSQQIEDLEIIIVEESPRPPLVDRGIVPQLWANYSGPPDLPQPEEVPCDIARLKCAFRSGCGLALQNYAIGCLGLVKGQSDVCNTHCRHSLIALLSTFEGQRLMKVSKI